MRKTWAGIGLSGLLMLANGARADDIQWRPAGGQTPANATSNAAPTGTPRRAASLGLPVTATQSDASPAVDSSVAPAAFTNDPPAPSAVRAQGDFPPPPAAPSLQPPPGYSGPPPVPPPVSTPAPLGGYPMPNEEIYNRGMVTDPPGGPRAGSGFGSGLGNFDAAEYFGTFSSSSRAMFQSDHCFDNFISPITNPFLFEDPRALTEVRPIFMQQGAPGTNWVFNGGNAQFFGTQARVAITDRVSFVINKFGGVWTEPHNPPPGFSNGSSFAELWLGPKYTFLRNENSGTVGAIGWIFQIPTGGSGGNTGPQNVGGLSNTPYISMAQNFWRTSYGSMNAMGTMGLTFDACNQKRSDYFFMSAHLDYDILQAHTWYPVLEMNFFDYTQAGVTNNLGFEGRDLVNYGSQAVSGRKNLTIAPGFRWVFWKGQNNASAQTGLAVELPMVGTRDILEYRITWDMILRY
jgi:hypothetical protein